MKTEMKHTPGPEAILQLFRLVHWNGQEEILAVNRAVKLEWNGRAIDSKTLLWLADGSVLSSRTDDGELYAYTAQDSLHAAAPNYYSIAAQLLAAYDRGEDMDLLFDELREIQGKAEGRVVA